TIWVGTGESVSGRHVAWGDGVYRSDNGGTSWTNTGLEASEHVGAIVVDPRDSNRVLVAAEGPLWSSGGSRGVYRSADGGQSWEAVLTIDDDTGVTKLAMAPDDPDVLYAAAYQRRRHVATFVGGGPGSGIYKSIDGGTTWRRLTRGLPEGDMGKIGLAVTPADPNLVYATIEADESERGFYRSIDRGESWEKRNEYVSGGTGPHYYQELFASPVDPGRVYQIDVFLHATADGGKTFEIVESARNKHSDNHVVWIDPDRPRHLLVGTDAGLYETFDDCASFRHVSNLPISQIYRVAVDTAGPFYNVLAGTQDLGTLFGPARTANIDGVRNQDWTVPLGADGYHCAFHPTDADIAYLEWQTGNVMRWDRSSGELQGIQPRPEPDDPPERWNWDTPIVVSAHKPDRLFVASQRVWRSDDRGQSWTAISGNLTTDLNRYELPTFGSVPSVDGLYDHQAMSWFSTITHLCESTLVDGLLYVGTDDGLVQVSDDGGSSWRRAGHPDGLPTEAFINNVVASRHDSDVVYLAADDHKHGDFSPRLYRSRNRGSTWELIIDGLPDATIVWAIEQDHLNPELLFAATEFGLYTSLDGGDRWHKLSGGVPTISFRDLTIQRDADDLIGASFGRGIYILDDYGPLRCLAAADLEAEAVVFPVQDAWWYVPRLTAQAIGQPTLGSTAFRADNPPFGATITYHLADQYRSAAKQRQADEKDSGKTGGDIGFPGWETLWEEHVDRDPVLLMVIRDEAGTPVRHVEAVNEAGLQRVSWDLRRAAQNPVTEEKPGFKAPWEVDPLGPLVQPGRYSAELVLATADGLRSLGEKQWFEVRPIPGLSGDDDTARFIDRTERLARQVASTVAEVEQARTRLPLLRTTIRHTATDRELLPRFEAVHRRLEEHRRLLVEDPVRNRLAEPSRPTVGHLVDAVSRIHWKTTQAPTATQVSAVEQAEQAYRRIRDQVDQTMADLDTLIADLDAAGGTWTSR
ncbi:MAG: glycosyl hydrolase, partial [Acidimicrobiia bacterium]|nr:glycosyl hydrolase [Acidimicrobiia bacterium]